MNNRELMNNEMYINMINQNIAYINKIAKSHNHDISEYEIAIVLGSGLSNVIDDMNVHFDVNYGDIPFMPVSTVKGHKSRLVFGVFNNKKVVIMDGRFHYYEGYNLREVTMPIRMFKSMGIQKLILTNSAGASNPNYKVCDIMIIKDHVNFTGINPLIGQNLGDYGDRFPALNSIYDNNIIDDVYSRAKSEDIPIHKGVYMFCTGPSYETDAEVQIMNKLGIDARAMSTVPEIIIAAHSNMKVLAFSCITNVSGANVIDTHEEVVKNAEIGSRNMKKVLVIATEVI